MHLRMFPKSNVVQIFEVGELESSALVYLLLVGGKKQLCFAITRCLGEEKPKRYAGLISDTNVILYLNCSGEGPDAGKM